MSFNINNWGRWSVSYNSFPPNEWAYTGLQNGETDTIDDIKVDGFFNEVQNNFLKVGHLIYIEGVASIVLSRQLVVVTGLDPVVVEPLNGLTPIVSPFFTASVVATAVGVIQPFLFPGPLPTDIIFTTISANPTPVAIISSQANVDGFTLEFSANPGAGMGISVVIYRAAFQ